LEYIRLAPPTLTRKSKQPRKARMLPALTTMCSRHWRRRTESLSRHRRVTRASTPKSPTLMQDLATRSLRPRNCPAARTHNRNRRRGNEVSLSAFREQALARENKMPRIPNLPPVKTRLPLAAWAFAGLITLCSIISSLVHGLAPGHGVVNWEQARASINGVMSATMLR